MDFLNNYATMWGLFTAIGIATDLFLHGRHKSAVYDFLLRMWSRLVDVQIPDIPTYAARKLLTWASAVIGHRAPDENHVIRREGNELPLVYPKWTSWRAYLIWGLLSASLTLGAMTWANTIDFQISAFDALSGILAKYELAGILILSNLIFDIATLAVTAKVLEVIARRTSLMSIAWIIVDLALALLFAALCIVTSRFATGLVSYSFSLTPYDALAPAIKAFVWLVAPSNEWADPLGVFGLFFSLTTFIPTAICLLLIATLILAKPIGEAGRMIGIYLLGSIGEYEPHRLPVGAMSGVLIACISSIIILIN